MSVPENRVTPVDVERFERLFRSGEQWLMQRILGYAVDLGYAKYTSTLEEAWRLSICGLTDSLMLSATAAQFCLDIRCEEDVSHDPAVAFGIEEARKHRTRGIPFGMFLALMKYYAQSYEDLCETLPEAAEARTCRLIVARFFDRVEIAFTTEWAGLSERAAVTELQDQSRAATDEKIRYLTVFESVNVPVVLLDRDGLVENLNEAAAQIFGVDAISGSAYYSHVATGGEFAPVGAEIQRFLQSKHAEEDFERDLTTAVGTRHFIVRLKRMVDVTDRFTGITAVLTDITERKVMEDAALQSRAQYLALFENMVDAFAQHDAVRDATGTIIDYRFTEVNPAFEEMFDLAAEDVIGRLVGKVWPPGGADGFD